jgi:mannose-6-phosphate isomerase-like protein (cupin superfamily)
MSQNHYHNVEPIPHPKFAGVSIRCFFGADDNDRLSNAEVTVAPGFQILPHIHERTTEFMYVVNGTADFLLDGVWQPVVPGDAVKAPLGLEHGFRNTGDIPFVLSVTFSPAFS